jgi:hypothetical protein
LIEGKHAMSRILGAAAIVAMAFSAGSSPIKSAVCCGLNQAKAESVVRAQRQQNWRYAFARSLSVVAGEKMV